MGQPESMAGSQQARRWCYCPHGIVPGECEEPPEKCRECIEEHHKWLETWLEKGSEVLRGVGR